MTEPLPFTPTAESAEKWLTALQKDGPKSRAHRLYRSLKALNQSSLEPASRLEVLETLRHGIYTTSEMLAAEFTAMTPPLGESARSTAKLSVFLHHELARGYERLPPDPSPFGKQRALASLAWMMLRIVQLGEPLSGSTWRRLFDHYLEGENEGWLDVPVHDPLSPAQTCTPIDSVRCILAFMAMTPMWLEAAWLPRCLLYLERNKDKITITADPSGSCWCFDPRQAKSARFLAATPDNAGNLRYLRIETKEPPELPDPIARKWQHQLDQLSSLDYQKEKRVDELWCGRECAVTELERHQRGLRRGNGEWLSVPDFELLLPDAPTGPTHGEVDSDWRRPHRHVNALLKQHRHDSAAIIETHVRLRPGGLLGLKLLDDSIVLAVVRWSRPGMFGNAGRFGLDLLPGRAGIVTAIVPGLGPGPAIHVASPKGNGALVVPQTRLKPGTSILMEENEYRIAKLLEWGDDFSAYTLAR